MQRIPDKKGVRGTTGPLDAAPRLANNVPAKEFVDLTLKRMAPLHVQSFANGVARKTPEPAGVLCDQNKTATKLMGPFWRWSRSACVEPRASITLTGGPQDRGSPSFSSTPFSSSR